MEAPATTTNRSELPGLFHFWASSFFNHLDPPKVLNLSRSSSVRLTKTRTVGAFRRGLPAPSLRPPWPHEGRVAKSLDFDFDIVFVIIFRKTPET